MEIPGKNTHTIVEDITADSGSFEQYIDTRPKFQDFADVFGEFMHDFIHDQELAGRKLSDTKKKEILYDRSGLVFIWDRHIKTWRDAELFLAVWVKYHCR